MLGKNAVASPFREEDGSLLVTDVFPTIQGEGPDAGRPAVFIRLSRCNLRCSWCDTNFDDGERCAPRSLISKNIDKLRQYGLAVITGGEPLLQNIVPLIDELNAINVSVSIETAGTVYAPGLSLFLNVGSRLIDGNKLVCSPKTPKLDERVLPLISAYKYVVRADEICDLDGLPNSMTQAGVMTRQRVARPHVASVPVYVQPCDEGGSILNRANLDAAVASCRKHGYRLSIQLHKIAGVP